MYIKEICTERGINLKQMTVQTTRSAAKALELYKQLSIENKDIASRITSWKPFKKQNYRLEGCQIS